MVASLKFIRFVVCFFLRGEVSPLYLQIYSIHRDSACLQSFPSVRDAWIRNRDNCLSIVGSATSEPTASKDLLTILISFVNTFIFIEDKPM